MRKYTNYAKLINKLESEVSISLNKLQEYKDQNIVCIFNILGKNN